MSEEMPSSWRYLSSASSRLSSFKGYLQSKNPPGSRAGPSAIGGSSDNRQSWRAWAGQKIKIRRGTPEPSGTETVNLFPGWAARRYRKIGSSELQEAFEVEVFISGFASNYRSAESASRSQRAFIRLAKGFASLPKITADAIDPEPLMQLSPSTEELLAHKKLPPRPTEMTEEFEMELLERQLQRITSNNTGTPSSSGSSSIASTAGETSQLPERNTVTALSADVLRKMHANLESRLYPFWSSVLSSRKIQLQLYASPHHHSQSMSRDKDEEEDVGYGPVAVQDIVTAADGSFQTRFIVNWEELCQHPSALHIAFGDQYEEQDLLIAAFLFPAPVTPPSDSESNKDVRVRKSPVIPEPKTMRIPITHSPIRVISDIDDTVKLSNVLNGARAVFQNVFVKDLKENIIPGMGEWYTSMWSRGISFHYVSNGPFELLPVVSEFLKVSQLPPGSIKLKSYAGRSIFNGLLSAPATRKRAGVVDILDAFSDSRFFLIGDTGEQDLELYADLARERPNQILAVLVRDVETGEPIDDPTGWKAIGASGTRKGTLLPAGNTDDTPRPARYFSDILSTRSLTSSSAKAPAVATPQKESTSGDYFTSSVMTAEPEPMAPAAEKPSSTGLLKVDHSGNGRRSSTAPPQGNFPLTPSSEGSFTSKSSVSSVSSSIARMSEPEKKRQALQMRVYMARTQMPGHVPLRVFRGPSECVEVEEILGKEK
ncbi:hypothetical protein Hypma_003559 [Hypsizygus marmoreus]|uniref:Phosphatidate phosphatase APP1 catalytic domain-containing protein n=1 Tax=Hypsizygus marmoreus TaxID=39966 RepID=A0A369J495_HYPMA|nr:hypothetical protein Hypma_003559 [Hypsizygus marmoreus]